MPLFNRNSFSISSCFFFVLVLCCCLAVVTGCKNYALKDSHAEYFNQIFSKVDSTGMYDKEKAFTYLDSAFHAFPNPGVVDACQVFDRKWQYYFSIKNYAKAMVYADSMLLLTEKRRSVEAFDELYAKALIYKGNCFLKLKNYDEALDYYYAGKQHILNNVKDRCSLVGYSGSLANLYFAQGKYLLAAASYKDDFREHFECSEEPAFYRFSCLQGDLNNVGLCYLNTGLLDSALKYCNDAIHFIDINGRDFTKDKAFMQLAKAVVYANLAEVMGRKGLPFDAEELFKKSIQGTAAADPQYTQSTQVRFALFNLNNNRLPEANLILQQLKASLDTLPNEAALLNWYKLKTDYYNRKNEIETSYRYLQKYLFLRDSAEAKNKKFNALDVTSEFENREQKTLNESLKKDNELKTVYLVIAALTAAMSIVIIILIEYNLKRSAKHAKQQEMLNIQIQQKNGDLEKTLSSLEQSNYENNRIMRIVAHDLRNPVSAINNLVYSLLKKEHSQSMREILEVISTACSNSMVLIKDLLTENKALSTIRKELVDMGKLLHYCVELLQAKADEKKQRLQLQIKAENIDIMLHRQNMWRVINNVINNAIKFSPENTVINIKLEKKKEAIVLSVQDNGIGIPDELKDKIFTILPGEARTGTAGEESYGLGLSISQKIIAEHNGKIWFDSTAGEGSVFYIELPGIN